MADYRIHFASSAAKELNQLSRSLVGRIVPRIGQLAAQPRPPGYKKLQGGMNEWRIRIGDYRVVYAIDDAQRMIDITRIAHRREVYRP